MVQLLPTHHVTSSVEWVNKNPTDIQLEHCNVSLVIPVSEGVYRVARDLVDVFLRFCSSLLIHPSLFCACRRGRLRARWVEGLRSACPRGRRRLPLDVGRLSGRRARCRLDWLRAQRSCFNGICIVGFWFPLDGLRIRQHRDWSWQSWRHKWLCLLLVSCCRRGLWSIYDGSV
jgi:hypothetical protein